MATTPATTRRSPHRAPIRPGPSITAGDSPEAPARWRLDELSRQRGRVGIALARASLQAALERRAARNGDAVPDGTGADGFGLVA